MTNNINIELAIALSARAGNNALQAVVVTVVFASVARCLKGVTVMGAVAGALVSFAMYASAGPAAFVALVSVFVVAIATTRVGYSQKQKLGAAEKQAGRSASQILANLGVAAVMCILFALSHDIHLLIATAAALAEAAADTASSEIGEVTSEKAWLITTFECVPAGTDGGITLSGSLAGLAASCIVAACCLLARLIAPSAFWIISISGFLGMLLDSVLGAVLERRRLLNNDAVNLLGTFSAALIALLLARILS